MIFGRFEVLSWGMLATCLDEIGTFALNQTSSVSFLRPEIVPRGFRIEFLSLLHRFLIDFESMLVPFSYKSALTEEAKRCFCMFTYLVIRSTKRPKNESKLTQNDLPNLHQTCRYIQPTRQSEKRRGKREESKETIQIPTKSQPTGKQEEQHPINLGRISCYGVNGCDHDDDRVLFGVDSNPCDDDGTISE